MSLLPEDIVALIQDEIDRRGIVLLELRRRGQRNTTVLEVIVDSEKGVSLDDVTELTRWISALLDEHEEEIPGRYRLEVSSAGLDRPLEYDWQFRKNIGRLIKLTFDDEAGTRRSDLFRLMGIDSHGVSVAPKGKQKKGAKPEESLITIPHERIKRAVVEPEF
jgi:ribosome maturation factor RimP